MAEIYYNILDTNVIRSFAQAHIDAPEGMIKALDAFVRRQII